MTFQLDLDTLLGIAGIVFGVVLWFVKGRARRVSTGAQILAELKAIRAEQTAFREWAAGEWEKMEREHTADHERLRSRIGVGIRKATRAVWLLELKARGSSLPPEPEYNEDD